MNSTTINNTAFAKEKAKPGYKKTKLGWIPEEWDVKELSKLGIVLSGLTYSPKDVTNDGTLVLRSSNIQENQLSFNDNVFVDTTNLKFNKVIEEDILICVRNGSKKLIGKNASITKEVEGEAFGAFMSIYRSKYNPFLKHYFKTELYQKEIHKNLGATINSINGSNLKRFKVPFPPLSEQQKIASILNTWDKAIAAQEQLIAQKQALKKGLMQVLLTGKKRFDGFNEEWETSKLGDIFTIQGRVGWKGYKKEDLRDSGPIVIGAKHIKNQILDLGDPTHLSLDKYEESPEIQIKINDLLIVQRGSLGKVAVIENDIGQATINPSMAILRPLSDNVSVKYIYYFLCSDFSQNLILSETGSTGVPMISQKQIATFKMTYPPIKEQNKIVNTLEKIDEEFSNLYQILGVLKKQKQGLMQQLLTGEKRVKME